MKVKDNYYMHTSSPLNSTATSSSEAVGNILGHVLVIYLSDGLFNFLFNRTATISSASS